MKQEILKRKMAQRANDKEDAVDETDILFSHTYVICRGAGAVVGQGIQVPET